MKYEVLSTLNIAVLLMFLNECCTAQVPIDSGPIYANLKAASLDIKPGDTVYLHHGGYYDFKPFINSSE